MANNTMRGFNRRITEVAREIEANSDSLVRSVVITVASSVALSTPADTGRARANWRTNLGSANVNQVTDFPEGKKGSTAAAAAAQAINDASTKMDGYKGRGDVYISNNLPYIGRLNTGHSTQAPAGFIETAINAGMRAIAKSRLVR